MEHSFHGRTMGALSVTGNPAYRAPFEPMIGNVKFAQLNDFDSVLAQVTDKTCAILFETVQGEGGIYPATEEFMQKVRALCDERDILLMLDEVQCGMGRCGEMFAWQRYGIKPDVMASAKALGCGVPVGAFAANEKVAAAFEPGDHGTTYGGNPFVCAAVVKVFDLFEEQKVLDKVKENGEYLYEKLEEFAKENACVKEHRGFGFMQGLEFTMPVKDIAAKALENGLILISAGANTIRFLPPLVMQKAQIDEMIEKLKKCM
jgi:acetylornithine/N-succinyldiaminopimelate aminotransferase